MPCYSWFWNYSLFEGSGQELNWSLDWVTQLVGVSFCTPNGCEFNLHSGHIPRLQIWSPVWVRAGGNQLMFFSHIDLSLSLSLCLSQINKHTLNEDFRKEVSWRLCLSGYGSIFRKCRHRDLLLSCSCPSFLSLFATVYFTGPCTLTQLLTLILWSRKSYG